MRKRKKGKKRTYVPPLFDEHHVHPKYREGKNGFNKRIVDYKFHQNFNKLFKGFTVYEAVVVIKQCWTDERGQLKYEVLSEHLVDVWLEMFQTLDTQKAADLLIENMAHKHQNYIEYQKWLFDVKKQELRPKVLAMLKKYGIDEEV